MQEASGVIYTTISGLEHAERATGSLVAAKLADGLGLCDEERERFLIAAAGTRRRDRLVGYARTLAPEILNFVPKVLTGLGIDLQQVEAAELRQRVDQEPPEGLKGPSGARSQKTKAVSGMDSADQLVVESGGRKYVCTLLVVPTP